VGKGFEGIKDLIFNPPLPLREGVRGEGKTAKALRKRSTDLEMLVWKYLRAKQMEGLKFRRQQPIGRYIVDFVCFEGKIIIEADGGQHSVETREDTERDE
jgi:very-short-patch-repair endonuclease